MAISPYVRGLRERVGHDLLLLPGVTAVIVDAGRLLLARQQNTGLWSMIGGGIEPGEDQSDALQREVREELGVVPTVGRVLGAYGGPELTTTLPNGDVVAYVTIAYRCSLPDRALGLDQDELIEAGWFEPARVLGLERHSWIDRVIADLARGR